MTLFNCLIEKVRNLSLFNYFNTTVKTGDQVNSDKSTQQVAGRDIVNYGIFSSLSIIEEEENWNKLIGCFNKEALQTIINIVINPTGKQFLYHNIEGVKKNMSQKFKNINIYGIDPRAEPFNCIRERAFESIDDFIESKDVNKLEGEWLNFGKNIKTLRRP
jgi:hypothetical protein